MHVCIEFFRLLQYRNNVRHFPVHHFQVVLHATPNLLGHSCVTVVHQLYSGVASRVQ